MTPVPRLQRILYLLAVAASLAFPVAHLAGGAEPHLANIRQLTHGGENAEAYWSSDGRQLIFQGRPTLEGCDQIYVMNADGTGRHMVSTGAGRCTCSYFTKDGRKIIFSSTHADSPDCPPPPDFSRGYVWPVYDSYKIYEANADGSGLEQLSPWQGYNAEATISPDGKSIVFTSDRDGDLELYRMDVDGLHIRRLTKTPGYDGGAFFSPDSKKIVYRAHHPTDPKELQEYRDLLAQHLVKPSHMEVMVMDADGANVHQVTRNGAANFAPFFLPDGKRIIFASNLGDPQGRRFDLYLINEDGTGLEQVTDSGTFDAFPMFSPDGRELVWASNRNASQPHETNIFVADWVDGPPRPAPGTQPAAFAVSEENLKKTIYYLASDEMKGRLTGSPEGRKAAEYVAAAFRQYGLQSPPGMKELFQPFEFISAVKLGPRNLMVLASDRGTATYAVEKDFIPTGFSDDAALEAIPVVFAGYGITAPDQKWDDYSGLDVKGKAVFVYRYGPEGDDPKSPFALYYPVRYKAMIARERGAAALLVVGTSDQDDDLMELKSSAVSGPAGIPVISVTRALLRKWLKEAGEDFPDPKNPHGTPLAFDLPGVKLSLTASLIREKSTADNVLGWLPATAPTAETVIVGAHYDHLGLGIEGSLAEKKGGVHHGADDNASGTAGVMELARCAAGLPVRQRNLLFMAFGGEELGTLGSSYYVKNPAVPLRDTVAMVNLDMVGRLREDKLVVNGSGTSPAWKDIIVPANTEGLKLTQVEDGYGASDQGVFYSREIPVLFYFTGAHPEYHRPEDTADLINYAGEAKVLRYVSRSLQDILALPEKPAYVRVKASQNEQAGRGFRVYLGTIPDYTEEVKGVKLMGVRADSPAEKAGIKGGDVIVEFGGKAIANVYDYTFALQEHRPGEVVAVTLLRDAKPLTLQVTLGKRPGE